MAELLDHEIDGIQEYDNPPPPWLMFLFYLSIVFGIGYAIYYPSFWFWPGIANWSAANQYEEQVEREEAYYAQFAPPKKVLTLAPDDENVVKVGKEVFDGRCVACHGTEGEGKIGPSFLDDTWLYDSSDEGIVESVRDGRPKGMPAWGKMLSEEELVGVTSYIKKLNQSALQGG